MRQATSRRKISASYPSALQPIPGRNLIISARRRQGQPVSGAKGHSKKPLQNFDKKNRPCGFRAATQFCSIADVYGSAMKQPYLFLQSIAASIVLAITIWAIVGAPPHQNSRALFIVASRR
jgi:hypothetical protein